MHTTQPTRLFSARRESDGGWPIQLSRTHPDLFDDESGHDFLVVNPRPDLLEREGVFHDRRRFGIDYP